MVKKIPLTQGKFALVDDEDFEWLNQFKWHVTKERNCFYARSTNYVTQTATNPIIKAVRMHRLILNLKKDEFADHIDGNGLNNQKNNLRKATIRQNAQNRKHGKKKTSKYPGVHWKLSIRKWVAQLKIKGKYVHAGTYFNELDAFNAYKKAVHELTGEKLVCELKTAKEEAK